MQEASEDGVQDGALEADSTESKANKKRFTTVLGPADRQHMAATQGLLGSPEQPGEEDNAPWQTMRRCMNACQTRSP